MSIVVAAKRVSVAVGRGEAPDVFVRLGAAELLEVRAGRRTFLSAFHVHGAALDGDDSVLLYLAGLFDDDLWSRHWGISAAGLAAAVELRSLLCRDKR